MESEASKSPLVRPNPGNGQPPLSGSLKASEGRPGRFRRKGVPSPTNSQCFRCARIYSYYVSRCPRCDGLMRYFRDDDLPFMESKPRKLDAKWGYSHASEVEANCDQ